MPGSVSSPGTVPEAITYIYRPYFRKKDGTIVWAKTYGKKVFRIPVEAGAPPVASPAS